MNELVISLDPKKKLPLYEQIYYFIKEEIQNRKLPRGEKLPSTRKLAAYLEVGRSTVELAYEQLVSEGFVEARAYKGYYVAEIDELYQFSEGMKSYANKIEGTKETDTSYAYDFSPNGIDLKSFPYNIWRKISKNVLLENESTLFTSGESKGEIGLRQTLCTYLHQARGVNCEPGQIIVGAGNEYLLMLLSTIIGQRQSIAFENPTYKRAYDVFHNLSHDVFTVDMDEKGMRMDALNKLNVKMAYVMPSHQYPMGIVMPIKRRLELLNWANEEKDRFIIEDDYDSEFRYKGKPIPALQGYDTHNKVIYMGTFSKSIAPAIRMSYMILPPTLLELYEERCQRLSSTVSKIDQLIVKKFIDGGYYERHLNKSRALYKGRHDTLLQSLKPLVKGGVCEVTGEHAGVHLLLEFKERGIEEELIERAKSVGVRVYELSEYFSKESVREKSVLLLGYANLSENEIQEAVEKLLKAWIK